MLRVALVLVLRSCSCCARARVHASWSSCPVVVFMPRARVYVCARTTRRLGPSVIYVTDVCHSLRFRELVPRGITWSQSDTSALRFISVTDVCHRVAFADSLRRATTRARATGRSFRWYTLLACVIRFVFADSLRRRTTGTQSNTPVLWLIYVTDVCHRLDFADWTRHGPHGKSRGQEQRARQTRKGNAQDQCSRAARKTNPQRRPAKATRKTDRKGNAQDQPARAMRKTNRPGQRTRTTRKLRNNSSTSSVWDC